MNLRTAILLPLLLSTGVSAQGPGRDSFQTPALLVSGGGMTFQRVWVVSASRTDIRYRETEIATATRDSRVSQFDTIFLFEPPDYAVAMDLFQGRDYSGARELFTKVKNLYAPVAGLENNPSTMSAFFEMECLRNLGDLEGLAAALKKFDKTPLTRENQLRQLELYLVWEAVRTENWQQVESLVNERAKSRLPGHQRAQLSYCHGLALEALERPDEAISAYHGTMISDAGASEEITRLAALRVLSILSERPAVKRAIRVWGTPEENTTSPGYMQLLEASALANLYEMTLGGGTPLPDEFKELLKFRPKQDPAADLGVALPPTEAPPPSEEE